MGAAGWTRLGGIWGQSRRLFGCREPQGATYHTALSWCGAVPWLQTREKGAFAVSRDRFLALSRQWGCAGAVHQRVNLSAGLLGGCIVKVMEHS